MYSLTKMKIKGYMQTLAWIKLYILNLRMCGHFVEVRISIEHSSKKKDSILSHHAAITFGGFSPLRFPGFFYPYNWAIHYTHSTSISSSLGSHPPSPADSGVSDIEPSSSSITSDEELKPHPRLIKGKQITDFRCLATLGALSPIAYFICCIMPVDMKRSC